MKYMVMGTRTEQITVVVEADDMSDAIDKADAMPRNAIDVWDNMQLWHDAEVVSEFD